MSFTAPKFTGVGRQLQTRVIAGDTLTFTVIKLGDGTMTTEPIAALTDLIHGIITLPVHEVRRNADYAEVTGVFQNAGLSSGFYWREIGIFAADPDYPNDRSHDILYCYQNAAELAEYIPSASSAVIEKIIRVACVVGDAENVTVGLASQAYAKAEDLQALEEQHSKDVERINNALDAVDPTKITAKAAPADGDGVMIADSADGGKAKRLLWSNVKAALGKLFVPLARKVNGKTLAKDVTLTGDDIAMGADDAESLRAAMAKRPLAKETLTLAGDINAKSAFPRGKSLVFRTTDSDWDGNMPSAYAAYAKLRSSLSGSYDIWLGASDHRFWFARAGDDAIPARNIWYELARCVAPEVHELPLADGWQAYGEGLCWYTRNQFKEVTIGMLLRSTSALTSDGAQFATLPEGFRPKVTVIAPVNVTANDYSHSACHVTINPDGGVYLHFDASSLSGKTVIQLVCPVFHYPVG